MPVRQYPIFNSFFKAAGFRLHLDHFLVDFLKETRFHLGQLTSNTVRIILGTAKLNRLYNLALGMNEIKYCYSLSLVDENGILGLGFPRHP